MKKLFYSLAAIVLSAMTFASCEDVPAPYELPTDTPTGTNPGTTDKNVIFEENFDNGKGTFTFKNVTLGEGLKNVWRATSYESSTYIIASAFSNSKSHASEAWAISPAINLSDCKTAHLTFKQAINKIADTGKIKDFMTVWVSTDKQNWQQLTVPNYPEGTSWQFVSSGSIDLSAYCGNENVYIGFKYKSEEDMSGSWEIDSFKITGDGTPMTNITPEEPTTPEVPVTGKNLLTNGDFETWEQQTPTNWKSQSSAGNATLSQSTDAHSGKYSVKVGGTDKSNKRIAYKEITLKAGTYVMTFYTKAATADGGSVRPGYVPVVNGNVDGKTYQYGDYVNDLKDTEWKMVQNTFTLDKETTLCLVVMNTKKPGKDVLIDDFSLTSENGGVVSTPTEEGTENPTPSTEAGLTENFDNGQGKFTIENKVMPDPLTFVWKFSEFNNNKFMKASAFKNQTKHKAESWLISPIVDLTQSSNPQLSFEQAIAFFDSVQEEATLYVKKVGGEWQKVNITSYPDQPENGYSKFVKTTVNLSNFANSKVQIAFVYKSSETNTGTWEIKNVVLK